MMGILDWLIHGKEKHSEGFKVPVPVLSVEVKTETNYKNKQYKVETTIDNEKIILWADKFDACSMDYWVDVICDGKTYGYKPEFDIWSYHKTGMPPNHVKIGEWVKKEVEKLRPDPLPFGSIKTTYRNTGKTKYSIHGDINGIKIGAYLKANDFLFNIEMGGRGDWKFKYNIETRKLLMPAYLTYARLSYMEQAIINWLQDEYKKLKETSVGTSR